MTEQEVEPDGARVNFNAEKYDEVKYMSWTRLQGETLIKQSDVEPLFSAETIKQLIKDKREEFNNGRTSEYPQKVLTELLEEVEEA